MTDELLLSKQIKNGSQKALETLLTEHHRLVVCVAKRFQDNGLSLHNLIMIGSVGLLKAAERFDETKGFGFISYAIWCIRQSIMQAFLENLKNKPIPLNRIGLMLKGNSLFSKLEHYLQREPREEEIVGMLEFQKKIMKDSLHTDSNHICSESFMVLREKD